MTESFCHIARNPEGNPEGAIISRRYFVLGCTSFLLGCAENEKFSLEPNIPFELLGEGFSGHFHQVTLTNLMSLYMKVDGSRDTGWKIERGRKTKIIARGDERYHIILEKNVLIFACSGGKAGFHYTFDAKSSTITSKGKSTIGQLDTDLGKIEKLIGFEGV